MQILNFYQIILVSLFIFLAIVIVLGRSKKSKLLKKHPAPGKMVDIGGYRLYIHCQGDGGPSVILDSGQGEAGLSWLGIQEYIANITKVCVYDRAGLGWSDLSSKPRTARVMADELHQLLENAQIPKPYLLVGASLGGLNARVYAHLYPNEVAGLVLVDAAHEEQYLPEAIQKALKQMAGIMSVIAGFSTFMVKSGLASLFPKLLPLGGGISSTQAGQIDRVLRISKVEYLLASFAEIRDVRLSHAEVREMDIGNLGDLPIIVIRHGKTQKQMNADLTEAVEETNRRLQAKVAGQSPNTRLVVAEQSGHSIQADQPELIVQIVTQLVNEIRSNLADTIKLTDHPNGHKEESLKIISKG
jgi:pimeloyl-ACP methyl ester carboxylesterase